VLALRDPLVHNWLDPTDMPEGILTLRWAEFAGGKPGASFGVKSRLTKMDELARALPPGCGRISTHDREQQLAARAASYAWRLAQEDIV
jgi:hypothetical protein